MATTSAGFDDIEALSSAWHKVAGYPTNAFSFAEVVALLDQNQDFAWRCCNTDPALSFGPQKEILWEVVDLEYRRPPLLRQRAATIWNQLRWVFIGHRETGCVFSGLDKDLLRALAKATVMVLLNEPEDTKLTADARAPWCCLLSQP